MDLKGSSTMLDPTSQASKSYETFTISMKKQKIKGSTVPPPPFVLNFIQYAIERKNWRNYYPTVKKSAQNVKSRKLPRLSIPALEVKMPASVVPGKSTADSVVKIFRTGHTLDKFTVPPSITTDIGDGGGFSAPEFSRGGDFQDSRPSRSAAFEEYDEYDDGGAKAPPRSSVPRKSTPKKDAASSKKEKDLFSFDDDDEGGETTLNGNGKGKGTDSFVADDDFDDFQSAAPTTSAPAVGITSNLPSLFDTVQPTAARGTTTATSSFSGFGITPPVQQPIRSPLPQQSFGMGMNSPLPSSANYQPNYFSAPAATTTVPLSTKLTQAAPPAKPSTDAFGSLWSTALGKDTTKKPQGGQVSMAQLAQEKSSSALWGAAPTKSAQPSQQGSNSGLDDLLL
jgi:hypothetical protein